MRCAPDAERLNDLLDGTVQEVKKTIAWVVQKRLPLETLFTANETFRDARAELVYARWRVESGEAKEIPRLDDWPKGGRWAPRSGTETGCRSSTTRSRPAIAMPTACATPGACFFRPKLGSMFPRRRGSRCPVR